VKRSIKTEPKRLYKEAALLILAHFYERINFVFPPGVVHKSVNHACPISPPGLGHGFWSHGWQSIGLGAVAFDAMATPTFGHPCPAQSTYVLCAVLSGLLRFARNDRA
jgi:hypothetical protein